MDQVFEKLNPATDKLAGLVSTAATKLNGGKEVEISDETVRSYAVGAFVIFLGFATTRMLRAALSSVFGLSRDELKAGAPTAVQIEFNKRTYELVFTADDYANEAVPSEGVTVLSLKFMVSKLLTPKIYESKNKAAALASQIINPNQFRLTYAGEPLANDFDSLYKCGVKTGDTIKVKLDDPRKKQQQESDEDDEVDEDSEDQPAGRKRVRNKAKKAKKAKKGKKTGKKPAASSSGSADPEKEYGDFPEPAVKPPTPQEEVDAILGDLERDIVPLMTEFIASPPADKTARDEEHHRLTELVLLKMFAMDGIDAADPEVRQYRKQAINKMHKYLGQLDQAKKDAK